MSGWPDHLCASRRRRRAGDVLLHTFSGADSAVDIGPADTGQIFTLATANPFGRSGQRLYLPLSTGARDLIVADVGRSDGFVELELHVAPAVGQYLGVVFRYVDSNNLWWALWEAGSTVLQKVVANTPTNVITATRAFVAGAKIRAVYSGPNLELLYNNESLGTAVDAFQQSATKIGAGSWACNNLARADNLRVR